MARGAKQRWLRVHSVFCTVCTFDPARPFFPKWYASCFLWNLSFFLLSRVCYTADCNVLTLQRSSCSSTLPISEPESCEQVLPLPLQPVDMNNVCIVDSRLLLSSDTQSG